MSSLLASPLHHKVSWNYCHISVRVSVGVKLLHMVKPYSISLYKQRFGLGAILEVKISAIHQFQLLIFKVFLFFAIHLFIEESLGSQMVI